MTRDGVKPASNSSIEISFMYKNVRCRERIKLPPTTANLKKARNHRASIIEAIYRGTFDYAITFPNSKKAQLLSPTTNINTAEYLDNWLKKRQKQISSSTYHNYKKIFYNRYIPRFGDMPLCDLNRLEVRKWCATLQSSNKTISNLLSPLRCALQEAYEDGILEENPIANWKYKNREAVKNHDNIDPFNKQEQQNILNNINEQCNKNMIKFLFWTGLRTSEMIALRWQNINLKQKTCLIDRAWTESAKQPEPPKTKNSIRTIKLLQPAIDALNSQKQHTQKHTYIFLDPISKQPWTGDSKIRKRIWIPALKKANIRYRKPYQTRHTFASMMLSSGENSMWLSRYIGHADLMTTLRVYGRWLSDADPKAGEKGVKNYG